MFRHPRPRQMHKVMHHRDPDADVVEHQRRSRRQQFAHEAVKEKNLTVKFLIHNAYHITVFPEIQAPSPLLSARLQIFCNIFRSLS